MKEIKQFYRKEMCNEILYLMGGIQKAPLRKKFVECLFIHAVNISSCVHSDH